MEIVGGICGLWEIADRKSGGCWAGIWAVVWKAEVANG